MSFLKALFFEGFFFLVVPAAAAPAADAAAAMNPLITVSLL
jgi:hypothetical protein